MSRFILAPRDGVSNNGEDVFLLFPTEGLSEPNKSIELPLGLVPRLDNVHNAESKKILDKLMMKITKANIARNKDGLVTVGSRVMDAKFDDFVLDCCNGEFSKCYEEMYCLLRKNGITF